MLSSVKGLVLNWFAVTGAVIAPLGFLQTQTVNKAPVESDHADSLRNDPRLMTLVLFSHCDTVTPGTVVIEVSGESEVISIWFDVTVAVLMMLTPAVDT